MVLEPVLYRSSRLRAQGAMPLCALAVTGVALEPRAGPNIPQTNCAHSQGEHQVPNHKLVKKKRQVQL